MPVREPQALGTVAQDAAARKYGLEQKATSDDFWDARYRSNGRRVQIKSASHSRADGPGVVRVWREHLRALQEAGGSVVVVVVSRDAPERPVRRVEKVSPSYLLELAEGRWRESQQADMAGKHEARFRWDELV